MEEGRLGLNLYFDQGEKYYQSFSSRCFFQMNSALKRDPMLYTSKITTDDKDYDHPNSIWSYLGWMKPIKI